MAQTMTSPNGQRTANGRFAPGNRARLKHGRRSQRAAAELFREHAQPLREREAEILRDLGGEAGASAVRRELVTRFVQASAIADSLAANIVIGGVSTAKGRTRAATTTFLAVLDRIQRLAQTIGLERRAKPTAGIREWADRALREQAAE